MRDEPAKLFTVDEANALIPKLETHLAQIQIRYAKVKDVLQPLEEQGLSPKDIENRLADHPQVRAHLAEIQRHVSAILETGAEFKGIEFGLVDFPFIHQGEIALLCWQYGEKEVRWWHTSDGGFSGRRPLPGAKAATTLN